MWKGNEGKSTWQLMRITPNISSSLPGQQLRFGWPKTWAASAVWAPPDPYAPFGLGAQRLRVHKPMAGAQGQPFPSEEAAFKFGSVICLRRFVPGWWDLGSLSLTNHWTALSSSLQWGSESRWWDVGCYNFQKMDLNTGLLCHPWPADASASTKEHPFLQQALHLQAALQEFVVQSLLFPYWGGKERPNLFYLKQQ